jgi:hypothetical protein
LTSLCTHHSEVSTVVPVLNELTTTPWRRMGSGCIDPGFLDLDTGWRWVVSLTPRPVYHREKSPAIPTHEIGVWVDPRTGLDELEKRKFLSIPGLELWALGRPARSQSLYRLRYLSYKSLKFVVKGNELISPQDFWIYLNKDIRRNTTTKQSIFDVMTINDEWL